MWTYTSAYDELYHYGTVGMHRGERNHQSYLVAPRGSGKGGVEYGEAAAQRARLERRIEKKAEKSEKKQKKREERAAERQRQEEAINRKRDTRAKNEMVQPVPDKTRDLTNEELQAKIDRLRMEDTYRTLMDERQQALNPKKVSKGKEVAKDILTDVAKKSLTTVGTAAVTYAGKQIVRKVFSLDDSQYKEMFGGGNKDKEKVAKEASKTVFEGYKQLMNQQKKKK